MALKLKRLGTGWLVLSAICALIGLFGVGNTVTWFLSMIGAPDTAPLAIPAAGAVLATLLLMIAVPLFKSWTPPRWVRIVLPVLAGIFGIAAGAATFALTSLVICDYQCRPVDTWKMLPVLIACGVMAALGPGVWALTDRRDRGELTWPITVAFIVIGFAVGLYQFVENGIY
ncbi:hypothetical protein [Enemella evansiae]|uniref:hypothetical protein n=1 Tax=Enemella evansiae TaxID=2016499 RepID=UPI00106048B8|nr:hypothetical protein [Enemella evansiae]TDO86156.1 hypothetical protein C8D81_3530 [Enemella evansiae]